MLPGHIETLLTSGGAQRIALLRLCVISITLEPVFVYLVKAYHLRPTPLGALALYDMFCVHGAPAQIAACVAAAVRDLRLTSVIRTIRAQQVQATEMGTNENAESATPRAPVTMPPRYLFDAAASACRDDPAGGYARLETHYNPQLSPEEHLPDKRMSMGQRQFVNSVWKPVVRRQLTAAGFWQIADIE